MKLAVAGTGYVGIVTGTGFANLGNEVLCYDVDGNKIKRLASGQLPIYEPGLEEIFKRNLDAGRLRFTADAMEAIQASDIIFICVGTPSNLEQAADLTAVKEVAQTIGRYMNEYKVVVNKSTVPVGTANLVKKIIKEHQTADIAFDVVSNPEFLREGAAVKDFENPDRIIIGTDSKKAEEIMRSLYRSKARTERPIFITDIQTAEVIKYASNAMLATRISFMNQLAHLCEKTGADIRDVSRGMGLDSRIGSRFLHAGLGFGGSCFPKDVRALIATLKEHGCESDLFEAVYRINEAQRTIAVKKLQSVLEIKGSTIAIWGLSFKPKTDDIREAPSLDIIKNLQNKGAYIHVFDPVAIDKAKRILKEIRFFDNPYETIRDCDALIVVTEWDEFRNLDMRAVKALLRKPIVVDGRNIYDPQEMRQMGFTYLGIGR
ncbi:MAG: UDP-glucose/GDP-mannose dehydrogenase family protein [Deltaproteobacteria bacterium]|nr:UDP-glucose/GDP-mannose dehydrogenase family protein [Deltaproteobacteria bacterium]MBW2153245.1 UDP-glucose/GDP-mannose dehydrogenase family protein [Deltaproteobacteria bacterium]